MSYTPKYLTQKSPVPGKKKNAWIFDLVAVFFLLAMLVGGGMYLRNASQSRQAQASFQELAALAERSEIPAAEVPGEATPSPYQVLYDQNPDFAGWLTVPGTAIDYPVVHTPEDIEYYIYRAFDGTQSLSGTPFVGDYGNLNSNRCIIYGHNMKDGTMFHDLLKYEEESFWQENPTFTVHTLEGERTYEIFSAVRTRVLTVDETGFRFYRLEEGLESWLVEESAYDTGIVPQEGDNILILSTCSYHTKEGRFIVAGKQILD